LSLIKESRLNPELEIDGFFPLALGRVQLRPDPIESARMIQQILSWRGSRRSNPEETAAWTGDLNGVWQVHRHPAFQWLTRNVETHVRRFSSGLGFGADAVGFQFQRSWPVVSEGGQGVGPHHHPNAHISCVYYLNGDGSGDSGYLRIHTPHRVNELVPGMAVGYGGPIDAENPFNRPWIDIAPVAGLLVLFPARTDHSVTDNETDEPRISISYDIHVSAPGRSGHPPEYLSPDPAQWDAFAPPENGGSRPPADRRGGGDRKGPTGRKRRKR
jgi:uncharacterized protein (TIGR02466 family)